MTDERDEVAERLAATPTGGTYRLEYCGYRSKPLPYDVSPELAQAHLEILTLVEERDRARREAHRQRGWSLFWRGALIVVTWGALVALWMERQ